MSPCSVPYKLFSQAFCLPTGENTSCQTLVQAYLIHSFTGTVSYMTNTPGSFKSLPQAQNQSGMFVVWYHLRNEKKRLSFTVPLLLAMNPVFLNYEYGEFCKDQRSIWVCNPHTGITEFRGNFPRLPGKP